MNERALVIHHRATLRAVVAAVAVFGLLVACTTKDAPGGIAATAAPAKRPNILVIVADDLGFSDLGAYGGEIATPNIDALASGGRVLTNFHTAAVCSPTRASLMSGADHHLAGLGNMAEVVGLFITQNQPLNAPWGKSNRFDFDNIPAGYRGHLSENALSMAELLRDAGYQTSMAGKWHLAYQVQAPDDKVRTWYRVKPDALPSSRGFDRSFALLNGGAAHFAPPQPPTPMDVVTYAVDGKLMTATALPRDFFSTAHFTNRLIADIDASRAAGKPFFAYAAYTAPHWPLQAPDADIAAQKGRYDEGYEVIRARRVERMKRLGLIPQAMQPHAGTPGPAEGGSGPKRWHELNASERAQEARLMEVYAAMVANLDHHVGRLVAHLKAVGEYDNTFVVFMSDNGAEGAPPFAPPIPGTATNNAPDNIGRAGSLVAYGPRWAEVSATPFRHFKGFTGSEGGTAVPMIVKLPQQTRALPISDARLQVTDVLPTVLEAAGIANPGARWGGRAVHPIEGVSVLAALKGTAPIVVTRPGSGVLANELLGVGYVVKGRWKLSRQPGLSPTPVRRVDVPWTLYDLSVDRGETRDVAAQHPQIVQELAAEWARYLERAGVVEQAQAYSGR